jgi:hypothetical protein
MPEQPFWTEDPAKLASFLRGDHAELVQTLIEDGSAAHDMASGIEGLAQQNARVRHALRLISDHAHLDQTERGIAECERYAVIADEALNSPAPAQQEETGSRRELCKGCSEHPSRCWCGASRREKTATRELREDIAARIAYVVRMREDAAYADGRGKASHWDVAASHVVLLLRERGLLAAASLPSGDGSAYCSKCRAPKGLHAVGESCNQNCGGRVVAAPSGETGGARCPMCGDLGWTLDCNDLSKPGGRMVELIPCFHPECRTPPQPIESLCFKGVQFTAAVRHPSEGWIMAIKRGVSPTRDLPQNPTPLQWASTSFADAIRDAIHNPLGHAMGGTLNDLVEAAVIGMAEANLIARLDLAEETDTYHQGLEEFESETTDWFHNYATKLDAVAVEADAEPRDVVQAALDRLLAAAPPAGETRTEHERRVAAIKRYDEVKALGRSHDVALLDALEAYGASPAGETGQLSPELDRLAAAAFDAGVAAGELVERNRRETGDGRELWLMRSSAIAGWEETSFPGAAREAGHELIRVREIPAGGGRAS